MKSSSSMKIFPIYNHFENIIQTEPDLFNYNIDNYNISSNGVQSKEIYPRNASTSFLPIQENEFNQNQTNISINPIETTPLDLTASIFNDQHIMRIQKKIFKRQQHSPKPMKYSKSYTILNDKNINYQRNQSTSNIYDINMNKINILDDIKNAPSLTEPKHIVQLSPPKNNIVTPKKNNKIFLKYLHPHTAKHKFTSPKINRYKTNNNNNFNYFDYINNSISKKTVENNNINFNNSEEIRNNADIFNINNDLDDVINKAFPSDMNNHMNNLTNNYLNNKNINQYINSIDYNNDFNINNNNDFNINNNNDFNINNNNDFNINNNENYNIFNNELNNNIDINNIFKEQNNQIDLNNDNNDFITNINYNIDNNNYIINDIFNIDKSANNINNNHYNNNFNISDINNIINNDYLNIQHLKDNKVNSNKYKIKNEYNNKNEFIDINGYNINNNEYNIYNEDNKINNNIKKKTNNSYKNNKNNNKSNKNNKNILIKQLKLTDNIISNIEPQSNFKLSEFMKIDKVGKGTEGIIYSVKWKKNNKKYALKKGKIKTLENVKKRKEEIKMLKDFRKITGSDGVIRIYGDLCLNNKEGYYDFYEIMELAEIDWDQEISNRDQIHLYYEENELMDIMGQIVKTLSLLQKNHITHRDIKPQNIMIVNGKFKICDFGNARILKREGLVVQRIRGSEMYMSPIMFKGFHAKLPQVKHNTYKSDVFSLGMCFLLASALSYNPLNAIREIYDMKIINRVIKNYLGNRYSEKVYNILNCMLQIEENLRPDFIQLEAIFSKNYNII